MARHRRVPGVLDSFTADRPDSLRALDSHPRIDRVFDAGGPLNTRLVRGRIRAVFHVDGRLWPGFLPRADEGRRSGSEAVHARLSAAARRSSFDAEALDRLAALLVAPRAPRAAVGVALQQAAGSAFHSAFHATQETCRAGMLLALLPAAPAFKAAWLRLSGAARRARATILDAARGDPYCAHAISLALPPMVESFARLRALWQATPAPTEMRSPAAALRALRGPRVLLRGVRPLDLPPEPGLPLRRRGEKVDVPETRAPLRRGTLIRLDRAAAQEEDHRFVFAEDSWSACPARDWVPELFAEIWRRAILKRAP